MAEPLPTLLSVERIWSKAQHNSMTDLIRFKNVWLCTFREGDQHVYGNDGRIRVIASSDAKQWNEAAFLQVDGVDLRDPKLSITPDGRLMLLVGGTVYRNNKYVTRQPRVAFSDDGYQWSSFIPILTDHEWLWRVTWHEGIAYGASYSYSNPIILNAEWNIKLFASKDGISYDTLSDWDVDSYPSEATVRFLKDGRMVALVRRGGKMDARAWIGTSHPPFADWKWTVANEHIGGPNFLILPDETMWAAGRFFQTTEYGMYEKTALARMTLDELHPVLFLPSSGDTSYPGMVYEDGILTMSYYSSHEGIRTSIYLAQIKL